MGRKTHSRRVQRGSRHFDPTTGIPNVRLTKGDAKLFVEATTTNPTGAADVDIAFAPLPSSKDLGATWSRCRRDRLPLGEARPLNALDYLLAVNDVSGFGALRLREEDSVFRRATEEGRRTTPPLIKLAHLLAARGRDKRRDCSRPCLHGFGNRMVGSASSRAWPTSGPSSRARSWRCASRGWPRDRMQHPDD